VGIWRTDGNSAESFGPWDVDEYTRRSLGDRGAKARMNCLRCGYELNRMYVSEPLSGADLWCKCCATGHRMERGIITSICTAQRSYVEWVEIPEGCLAVVGGMEE
jgi:transcription elongation factor Elf1